MRCEEFLNQLNARTDGELPADTSAELDAHLAECAQCREVAEGLRAIDADLRRAFAPRRQAAAELAERTAASIRLPADALVSLGSQAAPTRGTDWAHLFLAAAAGFLLAVSILRPWRAQPAAPAAPAPAPVAQLVMTSGPVEVQAASEVTVFRCPPGAPLAQQSVVRTGPSAQCEITLPDDNAVRLDCNTEITLSKPKVVEVNHGRVWSRSPAGSQGLEIRSSGGTIVPQAAAEMAVDCQPQAVRLIVIKGTADVRTGQQSVAVRSGKPVRIAHGKVEDDPERPDALLETAWVNSLLALRSAEHPELQDRVRQLLANVGAAKLSLLYEDELRRLGDAGVPPLLAYLDSTRTSPNLAQRATAARIVADVAQPRWVADLIALLTDPNADVRFHAARGLERLTGRDQGIEPSSWQSQPWASCEGAHEKWRRWWAANRERYPSSRREIAEPTSPPF